MKIRRKVLLLVFLAVCGLASLLQAVSLANTHYQQTAQSSGQSTLSLVAEAVDQAVGRFKPISGLIAGEPVFRQLLQQDTRAGIVPFTNEKLRQIAISVGASEVYVMDRTGQAIATSNYRDRESFLRRNFSHHPYFARSIAGQSAFFHALDATSGERGFFFSTPILDGIEVIGVLAVRIDLGALEQDWMGTGHEILIADNNGIVFLSSREMYRFRALAPLTEPRRIQIAETRQFPTGRVVPINLSADVIGPQTVQVTMGDPSSNGKRYLASSMPLTLAGWHAIVLTPTGPVQAQVARTVAFGALTVMVLLMTGLVLAQRRANILQRITIEQEQRVMLEEKVQERTADLDSANASLRDEVAERRNAEEKLRKSQKELIQAGKLAALGQMSAAISHEINQPLTAIKSYADNASEFLMRARIEDADENIRSISKMSDRIADISRHLRTFARQPGDTLAPFNVSETIAEMIKLVGPQLRAHAAHINFDPSPEDVWAIGGKLRLQQVLVNIVNNALEAMQDVPTPVIDIRTMRDGDRVSISLRDHGPGLPSETMDRIFDAFYTTKEAGTGMGLGMSISHNIISDFGGELTAQNHPQGGAIFTVVLVGDDATKKQGMDG